MKLAIKSMMMEYVKVYLTDTIYCFDGSMLKLLKMACITGIRIFYY